MDAAMVTIALMFVGLAVFMSYSQTTADKEDIQTYLESIGASNIKAHWDWMIGGRGTHYYDVEYTNRDGARCRVQCVGTGGQIYWPQPPEA